jgi:flagellar assembly factor FliW
VAGADATIVFSAGLVGCEDWKQFVLMVDADEDLPVAVLHCLDVPTVSLMVTDPTLALAPYDVPLTAEDRADIGLSEGERPQLFCTLSLTSDGWVTANLLGPLVINPRTRRGKQLVLTESPYSNRHPITRVDQEAAQCSS